MITYNNSVLKVGSSWLEPSPINLPPCTIRFLFEDSSFDPTTYRSDWVAGSTWTRVASSPNVWDYYRQASSWHSEFASKMPSSNHHVIASNTSGITNLAFLFHYDYGLKTVSALNTGDATDVNSVFAGCEHLERVPSVLDVSTATNTSFLFYGCSVLSVFPSLDLVNSTDAEAMFFNCFNMTTFPTLYNTGSVENFSSMFQGTSITSIPLFDTSSADTVDEMFRGCVDVQGGALAMYNQLSTQAHQPVYYYNCFYECGSDTVSGAAELAQIPSSWGGTGA